MKHINSLEASYVESCRTVTRSPFQAILNTDLVFGINTTLTDRTKGNSGHSLTNISDAEGIWLGLVLREPHPPPNSVVPWHSCNSLVSGAGPPPRRRSIGLVTAGAVFAARSAAVGVSTLHNTTTTTTAAPITSTASSTVSSCALASISNIAVPSFRASNTHPTNNSCPAFLSVDVPRQRCRNMGFTLRRKLPSSSAGLMSMEAVYPGSETASLDKTDGGEFKKKVKASEEHQSVIGPLIRKLVSSYGENARWRQEGSAGAEEHDDGGPEAAVASSRMETHAGQNVRICSAFPAVGHVQTGVDNGKVDSSANILHVCHVTLRLGWHDNVSSVCTAIDINTINPSLHLTDNWKTLQIGTLWLATLPVCMLALAATAPSSLCPSAPAGASCPLRASSSVSAQ